MLTLLVYGENFRLYAVSFADIPCHSGARGSHGSTAHVVPLDPGVFVTPTLLLSPPDDPDPTSKEHAEGHHESQSTPLDLAKKMTSSSISTIGPFLGGQLLGCCCHQ